MTLVQRVMHAPENIIVALCQANRRLCARICRHLCDEPGVAANLALTRKLVEHNAASAALRAMFERRRMEHEHAHPLPRERSSRLPRVVAVTQRQRQSPASAPPLPTGDAVEAVDTEEDDGGQATAADYTAMVQCMAKRFGLSLTVVGTGEYFRANDLDLVVTVTERLSLDDAYEHVRERTGWTCDGASGNTGVRLLRGCSDDGVPIEAQVWRGPDECTGDVERKTQRALQLADCIRRQAHSRNKRDIRLLHAWAECANIKGHLLSRLPGVAITCIAITCGRHRDDDGDINTERRVRTLLRAFREALEARGQPIIDFDNDFFVPHSSGERPAWPLQVIAQGVNVADRLTTRTTRFIHLMIGCAQCATDGELMIPNTMHSAARAWCPAATFAHTRVQHRKDSARDRRQD